MKTANPTLAQNFANRMKGVRWNTLQVGLVEGVEMKYRYEHSTSVEVLETENFYNIAGTCKGKKFEFKGVFGIGTSNMVCAIARNGKIEEMKKFLKETKNSVSEGVPKFFKQLGKIGSTKEIEMGYEFLIPVKKEGENVLYRTLKNHYLSSQSWNKGTAKEVKLAEPKPLATFA